MPTKVPRTMLEVPAPRPCFRAKSTSAQSIPIIPPAWIAYQGGARADYGS